MHKIKKINRKSTVSRDGLTVYHSLEWGRRPGERKATGLFTYKKPRTVEEQVHNKDVELKIRDMENAKSKELNSSLGFQSFDEEKLSSNFLDYYKEYAEKNEENRQAWFTYLAFQKFIDKSEIKTFAITEELVSEFRDHLYKKHAGVTPALYFLTFKKLCKKATSDKYFQINPAVNVTTKSHPVGKKDIIDTDEWIKLLQTPCLNPEIKKAAIFTLYTALRWVDVSQLDWKNVREASIIVKQQKTGKTIEVPLHETAMEMLGERKEEGKVFNLLTRDGARIALRDWVKSAGIQKKISWHCLRHSASNSMLDEGVPQKDVAGILGHESTLLINKNYQQSSQKRAIAAINSLPSLKKFKQSKPIATSDIDKQIELERIRLTRINAENESKRLDGENLDKQLKLAMLQDQNPLKIAK